LIAYKASPLCLPHLDYTSAAFGPTSKNNISGLEKIQMNAVRFIANIIIKGREDVEIAYSPLNKEEESDIIISL